MAQHNVRLLRGHREVDNDELGLRQPRSDRPLRAHDPEREFALVLYAAATSAGIIDTRANAVLTTAMIAPMMLIPLLIMLYDGLMPESRSKRKPSRLSRYLRQMCSGIHMCPRSALVRHAHTAGTGLARLAQDRLDALSNYPGNCNRCQ